MDRFLATTSVRKTHLQILAAACLLLASKLREPSCIGLPAELLVFYTDNSITRTDLIVSDFLFFYCFILKQVVFYKVIDGVGLGNKYEKTYLRQILHVTLVRTIQFPTLGENFQHFHLSSSFSIFLYFAFP